MRSINEKDFTGKVELHQNQNIKNEKTRLENTSRKITENLKRVFFKFFK